MCGIFNSGIFSAIPALQNIVYAFFSQSSAAIDAGASHYNFKPNSLDIVLRKKTPGQRWKTLEATRRGHGITSLLSNRNPSNVALNDLIPLEAMNLQSNQQPTIFNDIIITSPSIPERNTTSSNGNNSMNQKSPDPPRSQSQIPASPSTGSHTTSPSSSSGCHQHYCPAHGVYHMYSDSAAPGGSIHGPSTSKFSSTSMLAADLETSNPLYREYQLSHTSFT